MRSQRELATLVELRRRDLGMTQAQLAHHAGVSRQWVNSLEAGEGNPSLLNLVALLAVLGLELNIVEATSPASAPSVPLPDLDELVNRHRLAPGSPSSLSKGRSA